MHTLNIARPVNGQQTPIHTSPERQFTPPISWWHRPRDRDGLLRRENRKTGGGAEPGMRSGGDGWHPTTGRSTCYYYSHAVVG